jgi:hypothetical protein
VAEAGEYTLLTRATSASGRTQPASHDPLWGGYLVHHTRPIRVRVTAGQHVAAGHADLATLLYDMNAYAEDNMRMPLDVALEFSGGEGI